MGSFNATCIVSNLPIEAGTPVRYLALVRNAFEPEGNRHICYVTGRWQIHGVPIQAQYNDYGSVENIVECFTTQMFFDGLALSAIEVGVGDNSCHDVAVRKDMDRDGWLEALWEGRVYVDDWRSRGRKVKELKKLDRQLEEATGNNPKLATFYDSKAYEPTPGIPSFRRIEKVLMEAGHKISPGGFDSGLLVDDVRSGFVRVRFGGHSPDAKSLEALLPALHEAGYAAMITAGSGTYSKNGEILVAPLPSTDPNVFIHTDHNPKDFNAPRPVSLAMIREDVWQILLNTPIRSWSGDFDLKGFRSEALRALDEELADRAELAQLDAQDNASAALRKALRMEAMLDSEPRENIFRDSLRGSEGVSGFSFREAFRFGLDSASTLEEQRQYVLALADTIYVQWVYSILHGQWHPTTNSGQDGNWKEHRAFLTELLKIRGKWEDDEEDETEYEDETDEEE